jgi:hypothetical protein
MRTHIGHFLLFISCCGLVCSAQNTSHAQNSIAEFEQILRDKAAFDANDFAALEQGETVVKLLPVQDRREVAVSGLVRLPVSAEVFLQSFRDSMVRKSNPAILEIGRFSAAPSLDDLQSLTIEGQDLEDLKDCVIGNCRLKLSDRMIDRFHKEVDFGAADYQMQATQLLKLMLLDYVRDYLTRGDAALIEYHDKGNEVRLAQEQDDLMAASGYLNHELIEFRQSLNRLPRTELSIVDDAIVWSKIRFGLKPVIAFNHIVIYRRERETGPQVLIASKQIYANHYFDSSLALTAIVGVPGASTRSYLCYENRSRADGLEGAFGKIKRGIVEHKAVDSLKSILRQSQASLEARLSNESAVQPVHEWNLRRWTVGRTQLFLWLFCIIAFLLLFGLRSYDWKGSISGGTQ